jgi:hypothetical protein
VTIDAPTEDVTSDAPPDVMPDATEDAPCVSPVPPMPIISRNAPIYANSSCTDPTVGDDDDYSTWWYSCSPPSMTAPASIAIDLSAVPNAQRTEVVLAWYDVETWVINTSIQQMQNPILDTYTIDAHSAPGGGPPPTDNDPGWTNLQSVSANAWYEQTDPFDLTQGGMHPPFNWLRVRSTLVRGAGRMAIELDVHDASATVNDRWLASGDALSGNIFQFVVARNGGDGTFAQRIADLDPSHQRHPLVFPATDIYGSYGIGQPPTEMLQWIDALQPKFVALIYGTTATLQSGCDSSCLTAYAQEMTQTVAEVEARGAIPVMGHLPWYPDATVRATFSAMNTSIDSILAADANIVRGPDLWSLFDQHPEYWDNGSLSVAGGAAARTAWASAMLQRGGVYCR